MSIFKAWNVRGEHSSKIMIVPQQKIVIAQLHHRLLLVDHYILLAVFWCCDFFLELKGFLSLLVVDGIVAAFVLCGESTLA